MSRKTKDLPIVENVEITDFAAEGKALAKVGEKIMFVPFVAPGDVVDVRIVKRKSSYLEGVAVNFKKYSPDRIEAVCEHFGVCGGCKWQIIPYSQQIIYKQNLVEQTLRRIGKIDLPKTENIIGCKDIYFYRNKLEFTFSNKKWLQKLDENQREINMNGLGFHIPKMFDKVLDINKCWLQDDISNKIRNEIRKFAFDNNLSFFDIRQQQGFLRTLMIRNTTTGGLMVVLVFFYEEKLLINNVLNHVKDSFPQITSLLYVINSKPNDTITDQDVVLFYGDNYISEQMEGLKFKIGAKSFYQTNSHQAYELYKVVRNFACLKGDELVYDLYTGTGTIANFLAKNAKKVVGIDYVPEAIDDAKQNSKYNGIDNTEFFAGDMSKILTESFVEKHGCPDVIITDPPRAGMHQDVIKTILIASPQTIVYVSCNPATQARDVSLLDSRYRVDSVQPVDMFPHTHHIENVLRLIKR